jgi:hypothetical protein
MRQVSSASRTVAYNRLTEFKFLIDFADKDTKFNKFLRCG